ncbi:MAG: hypothetical protein IPG74_05990 [Flavobacteriales bacterium]|nr:hypothetical protein [Flavobacteriales bacterium]
MLTLRTATLYALIPCMIACKEEDPKQSEPYKQLEAEHHETTAVVAEKDSTINGLFGAFNRISENLRTIREKQGLLAVEGTTFETGGDAEQRMVADLQSIDALLAENRELIAKLRKQTKSGDRKFNELQRTVEDFERAMTEKDTEITSLKEELSSANSSLATLIEMYRDKEQLASDQQSELNAAWYCVGTAKELRANGVLTKDGGFIGIGKVDKLNTTTLNKNWFRQVDVTEVTEIPISAQKAKLVTSHPTGSYTMEGAVEKLRITDATAFWSMSKYLVIVVD